MIASGCAGIELPSSQPTAIGIILSPVSNSAQPDPDRVLEAALPALTSQGQVVMVEADGSPSEIDSFRMGVETDVSPARWKDSVDNSLSSVEEVVRTWVSTDREAAPLEAITLTVRSLDPEAKREIHFFGSGLQTTGSLPMQDGRLYLEPTDVAEFLDQQGLLPQLDSISVYLHGLGSVAGAQPSLDLASLTQLEQLWVAILERAGARVELRPAPLSGAPESGLPDVSIVDLREVGTLPELTIDCSRVEINSSLISFQSGNAQYVDGDTATSVLDRLAQELVKCPGPFVVLAGTSSAGTPESRAAVAELRATKIAEELASRGIERSSIETIPAGTDHCGFVPDRDSDGNLLLLQAAANRMVVVFATDARDTVCP